MLFYVVEHPDTIAFCHGRGILFYNVNTGKQQYFWPPDLNVSLSETEEESEQHHEGTLEENEEELLNELNQMDSDEENSVHEELITTTTATTTTNQSNQLLQLPLQQINTNGTSVLAFCRHYFAIAEKCLQPKIKIYSYTRNEKGEFNFNFKTQLQGGGEVEFLCMDFSRDGNYLISCSSVPDNKLCYWNLETSQIICSIELHYKVTNISLNPRNRDQICATGTNGYFCILSLKQKGSQYVLVKDHETLELKRGDQAISYKSDAITHCWGPKDELFIGTDSQSDVFRFDSATIPEGHSIFQSDESGITSITITAQHIILGYNSGVIRMYNNNISDLTEWECTSILEKSTEPILHMKWSMNYTRLFFSSQSTLYCYEHSKNQTRLVMDSHVGSIYDAVTIFIKELQYLVTVGEDGTIRIYKIDDNHQISLVLKIKTNTILNHVQVMEIGNGFAIFTTSYLGYFHCYKIQIKQEEKEEELDSTLLFREKIRKSCINNLLLCKHNIIVLGFEDMHLAILKFDITNKPIELIAFIKMTEAVNHIISRGENHLLLASSHSTLIYEIKIPFIHRPNSVNHGYDLDCGPIELYHSINEVISHQYKLDTIAVKLYLNQNEEDLFILTKDKYVKYYNFKLALEQLHQMQEEAKDHRKTLTVSSINVLHSLMVPLTPQFEQAFHLKTPTSMIHDDHLYTSGTDGIIWMHSMDYIKSDSTTISSTLPIEMSKFVLKHDPTLNGISKLVMTHDKRMLISVGLDGAILFYSCSDSTLQVVPMLMKGRDDEGDYTIELPLELESNEDITFYQKSIIALQEKNSVLVLSERETLFEQVMELRKLFLDLKRENELAPEDERLDHNDFMIDPTYEEDMDREIERRVLELRQNIKNANLKKELLADRLKREFWDPMDHHITYLRSFNNPYVSTEPGATNNNNSNNSNEVIVVSNYVLAKKDSKQENRLEKIRFMRRIEEIELQQRRKRSPLYVLQSTEEETTANEDTSSNQVNYIPPIPTTNSSIITDDNLLFYSLYDLFSKPRLINQMHLLKAKVLQMQRDFNKDFEEVNQTKKKTIARIQQLNEKIVEILTDMENMIEMKEAQKKKEELELQQQQQAELEQANQNSFIPSSTVVITNNNTTEDENVDKEALEMEKELQRKKVLEEEKKKKQAKWQQKLDQNLYKPSVLEDEMPSFVITNDNVKFERWISEEERIRLERERKLEEERIRLEQGGEAAERALFAMMNNQLEKEEVVVVTEEIAKPECLKSNKPKEEYTEADKKAIKEYTMKLKQKEDEDAKKMKQLEAKLKSAKEEIKDACTKFDQRLKELYDSRLKIDYEIYQIELETIKLNITLMENELNEHRLNKLSQILKDLEAKILDAKTIKSYLETEKINLGKWKVELERKDESEVKLFKPKFIELFSSSTSGTALNDIVDRLVKMLKSKSKSNTPPHPHFDHNNNEMLNPYYDLDNQLLSEPTQDELLQKTVFEHTLGTTIVSDAIWNFFVECKRRRMDYEKQMKKCDERVEHIDTMLVQLNEEIHALTEFSQQKEEEYVQFKQRLEKDVYNLESKFVFKQGQIEVEEQVVVTDYGDAVLINREEVEELNNKIQTIGSEKIKQMKVLNDLNKNIAMELWNNEMFDFEAEEEVFKMKRIQMLKVTKEMQALIKSGGSRDKQKEKERSQLQNLIQHSAIGTKEKVEEKVKIIEKYEVILNEKQKENRRLLDQITQLDKQVKEREHIQSIQETIQLQNTSDKKMKEMRLERSLKDVLSQQEEELKYLYQDIDRLRQRSYPSFAVVVKTERK